MKMIKKFFEVGYKTPENGFQAEVVLEDELETVEENVRQDDGKIVYVRELESNDIRGMIRILDDAELKRVINLCMNEMYNRMINYKDE